jgi:hypothetical protein
MKSKKKIIINKYKKLNKKIFRKKKEKTDGIVLVEFNAFQSSHIIFSYLANYFLQNLSSKLHAYFNYSLVSSPLKQTLFYNLKRNIGDVLNLKTYSIYRSFNTEKFIYPKITQQIDNKAKEKFEELKSIIKVNEDVIKIEIDNIKLGTLIYDGYKIYHKVAILNLEDKTFWFFLKDFIKLYYFWFDYIKNNNIKSVIGCHSTYAYGIPLRIALNFNIPAVAIEDGVVYSLTKKNPYQNSDFKFYKKIFSSFSEQQKIKARALASKFLQKRFDGKTGIDIKESRIVTSSFSQKFNKEKKILKQNGKLNVVIFTHEINDASNGFGETFYPDYYEWLKSIINISKNTDYNWYIKDHPKYHGKFNPGQTMTEKTTKDLIRLNPKITYLPSSTSHHQIINEGVNFALTVNGDIAYEYAYFNIPVLTASRNCGTYDYSFNVHSDTLQEYEKNLKNLKNLKITINRDEVLEFYFMSSIYRNHDILINIFSKFLKQSNNWETLFSENIYDFFTKDWNINSHNKILKTIDNFFKSKDYFLDYRHAEMTVDQLINKESMQ